MHKSVTFKILRMSIEDWKCRMLTPHRMELFVRIRPFSDTGLNDYLYTKYKQYDCKTCGRKFENKIWRIF